MTADMLEIRNQSLAQAQAQQQNVADSSSRHLAASPARTIESPDSTADSLDTIVDRALKGEDSPDGFLPPMFQNQTQTATDEEQQQCEQQQDTQSHIYSQPVYDEKPSPRDADLDELGVDVAKPQTSADEAGRTQNPNANKHPYKGEFKQQLELTMAHRLHSQVPLTVKVAHPTEFESRITKKQRIPPEFIKYRDDDKLSAASRVAANGKCHDDYCSGISNHRHKLTCGGSLSKGAGTDTGASTMRSTCSLQIILGTLQLLVAIVLIGLGSLLIVRAASAQLAGCAIASGLFAAITGSIGVVSMRKTQTAFLALSLICIAICALGLALTAGALSLEFNRYAEQQEPRFDLLQSKNGEISAAYGLVFALFFHLVVSIVSVYHCAQRICGRSDQNNLEDETIVSGKVTPCTSGKNRRKLISAGGNGNDKVNSGKIASMLLYPGYRKSLPLAPPKDRRLVPPKRQIVLVPGTAPSSIPQLLCVTPPMQYRGTTLPHTRRPPPMAYNGNLTNVVGTYKSTNSADPYGRRRRRYGYGPTMPPRQGKMEAGRRQRRKSEAEIIVATQNFQYYGVDRALADSFLERQEQSQTGSHIDFPSTNSFDAKGAAAVGERLNAHGVTPAISHLVPCTKIICQDVVM